MPVKFYFGLAVALTLGAILVVFTGNARKAKNVIAHAEVVESAVAGINDGVEIDHENQAVQTGITAARTQFAATKAEAVKNEPEVADRADGYIPDSVLAAFRERRLARERLRCSEGECW